MPRKKKANVVEMERPQSHPIRSIEDVLDSTTAPIEQKRIAYELMSLVGGERGLAKKIMDEYKDTSPGSLARVRFFEMLLKLVQMAQPKDVTGDFDYLSEDDIARILIEHTRSSGVALAYPTHFCI